MTKLNCQSTTVELMSCIREVTLPALVRERIADPGKWFFPLKIMERSLRKIGISICVETHQGLKIIGKGPDSSKFQEFVIDTQPFPALANHSGEFLVNPDFLIDPLSLAGKPLRESPHFSFLEAIMLESVNKKTDYVVRYTHGFLDLRKGEPFSLKLSKQKFEHSFKRIREQSIIEVMVIRLNKAGHTNYTVVDGKHRMAMAFLLQYQSRLHISILHPDVYRNPIFLHLYSMAKRKPELFSKNICLLEDIYGNTQGDS